MSDIRTEFPHARRLAVTRPGCDAICADSEDQYKGDPLLRNIKARSEGQRAIGGADSNVAGCKPDLREQAHAAATALLMPPAPTPAADTSRAYSLGVNGLFTMEVRF